MLTTTLQTIWAWLPKDDNGQAEDTHYWNSLLKGLGKTRRDNEPLTLLQILESCGMKCAVTTAIVFDDHPRAIRLYACYCARYVLNIFEETYPEEKAPRNAIEAAEKYAQGLGDEEDMHAASGRLEDWLNDSNDAPRHAASAANIATMPMGLCNSSAFLEGMLDRIFFDTRAALYFVWSIAGEAAEAKSIEVLRREFIRLCKLEGEYGEVDKLDNP